MYIDQQTARLPDGTEVALGDTISKKTVDRLLTGEVLAITLLPQGRYRFTVSCQTGWTTWLSDEVQLEARYALMVKPLHHHQYLLYVFPILGLGAATSASVLFGSAFAVVPVLVMNLVGYGMVTGHVPRFFYQWRHNRRITWIYFVWVYFLLLWDLIVSLSGLASLALK
ncbi:MAG TPA: hypothetical protein VNT26_13875 [Candidatus Sulfotelmatobacter sp.]|nr:hypothetical protein [Candidatus Sulfotelmatobacter sp.]HWI64757.1 hypothetical protein [Symbiobacteriaceae bacterium]